jgi:CubicO group peptidase (beta-lactamase class C family)
MPESSNTQRSGLSPERLRRLHRALQGYVQRGEIAGIVALIHRHGEEAHIETLGWQDKEAQIPMQRNTFFRIMSMTKPIIAVATLLLVEEGRLRLYDSVDPWLPELANRMVLRDPHGSPDDVYPAPRSITLHDLLTYRFGIGWTRSSVTSRIFALLPAQIADAMQIRDAEILSPEAWMARLGEIPLLYKLGERWLYHTAADVLGVLIARVAEQPLETFLQERIFTPLAMVDTSFAVPPEKRDRLAVAYAKAATGELTVWDHPRNTRWADLPLFPSGGAGFVSSVDDYQRFGRMLLNGGELDGVRLLSRKTVEAMTRDYLTPEQHTHPATMYDRYDVDRSEIWTNRGFGYGIGVRTRRTGLGPSVGSFFWPGAFGTTWVADPQEHLMATLRFRSWAPIRTIQQSAKIS